MGKVEQTRIVVLGAGYTGMLAALAVARRGRRRGGQVTLIDPSTRFPERLRMHQLASGQQLAEVPIARLLDGTGVRFVQGRATGLDLARRVVRVDTPDGRQELGYDTLVYAIGSAVDTAAVPGADLRSATRRREAYVGPWLPEPLLTTAEWPRTWRWRNRCRPRGWSCWRRCRRWIRTIHLVSNPEKLSGLRPR